MIKGTMTITTFGIKVARIVKIYGLTTIDITTPSLRASSARALLLGNMDVNTTNLLRRRRSDKMMNYLHILTQQLT